MSLANATHMQVNVFSSMLFQSIYEIKKKRVLLSIMHWSICNTFFLFSYMQLCNPSRIQDWIGSELTTMHTILIMQERIWECLNSSFLVVLNYSHILLSDNLVGFPNHLHALLSIYPMCAIGEGFVPKLFHGKVVFIIFQLIKSV